MKRKYHKYPKWAVNLFKVGIICFTSFLFWTTYYVSSNFKDVERCIKTKFQQTETISNSLSWGPYSDALCANFKSSKINVACPSRKN
jgi:hypothetical protein